MSTEPKIRRTQLLDESVLREAVENQESQIVFRPIPFLDSAGSFERPVWRVLFEMVADPSRKFGLDINGEITFGRGDDGPNSFDLTPFDAETSGVSRRHIMFRPTSNNLIVMDIGSTNGTTRNGRSIGIKTPYSIIDGDILSLGKLQFYVQILERPHIHTQPLISRESTVAEALSSIAKAITSQIDLDDVLNQVAQTAKTLTSAGEADIWLVDQNTGELFPEVQRSTAMLNGAYSSQFQMNQDPLVSKVMQSGKPVRAQKSASGNQHRLGTGHMMEALAYIPIMLGGIAFGVLRVGHREAGRQFEERDEQLLIAIADFAAIAIQNARLFQATDEELQRRVRELSALNEVSRSVSSSLDLYRVYQVLVDEINKYCPVEEVRLYLRDRGPDYLRLLRSGGRDTKRSDLYPANRGFVGEVIRFGDAIVTNDVPELMAYDPDLDGVNGRSAHSIAGIPLKVRDRVVGVLVLLNKLDAEFKDENIALLLAFANPVATAIDNSSLFAESIRQRRAIQATAETLSQPLLLLDDLGNLLVSNDAANELLGQNMSQLFEAISAGVGRTSEVLIGEKTYLSTAEHLPDVGTIIIMQDISYVKQLEQDRSDFLHMLSHDLKNPLMAITGWSSLIERTIEDERSGQYVAEIHVSADRMLKMINQLLDTVGKDTSVQLVREPCDLLQISKQILDDVKGAALHKNIDMDFVCEGEPYILLGDKTRLYHMVLNLVDNAIKYSPNDTCVKVKLGYSDKRIGIQVLDEGPGIPEEDLERIFNKYYRSSQTGGQSGSGLGLSAVKAIVEAHGGKVIARNRSTGGTNFEIMLPPSLRLNDENKSY